MRPTCLFIINGLGLGNSTRCDAVAEELADRGCQIHVLTSGNGVDYFRNSASIQSLNSMPSFFYSGKNGGVSGWSTFQSLWSLLSIARAKKTELDKLLDQVRPEVAIIDSEYAISPLRRRGIPIIGLNTSEMVVTEYLKRQCAPGTRSHFWFIEFTDYLFHKRSCDLVLSPFPLRTPTRHPKFRRIGLIARRKIKQKAISAGTCSCPSPRQVRRVVFMLSGSVHASKIPFEAYDLPFKIDVVGRSGESSEKVTYHGRQMDNTELLAAADALVINGGYSAVSEAFVLRKPVFVIPVPGHAEQFVNSSLVRDLGLGFVATETDILAQMRTAFEENRWIELKPAPSSIETNGGAEAAEAILAVASRHPGPEREYRSTPGIRPESAQPALPTRREVEALMR